MRFAPESYDIRIVGSRFAPVPLPVMIVFFFAKISLILFDHSESCHLLSSQISVAVVLLRQFTLALLTATSSPYCFTG
jgi:hypothetical protein